MDFNTNLYKIPSVLMRGGTSRGLIIKDVDLPKDTTTRDAVITKIYGSSKNGQIDGIGGGTSLTSKLAVVGISNKKESDIFYTFGQVDTTSEKVDYDVTCGNMASAVGLYAVEEGLVLRTEGITKVKIFNTNTRKNMEVEVPVEDGEVMQKGNFTISGVSGSGPKITVSFVDSGGAFTGKLLPTGNVYDNIKDDEEKEIKISILDTGNVVVFVKANDFSLNGSELSHEINEDSRLLNKIEDVRVKAGRLLGLFNNDESVKPETHALPKIVLVSEPQDYVNETNDLIKKNEISIVGKYITMGKLHKAFAVSGSICLATACKIPGTLPNKIHQDTNNAEIVVGHPSGTITVTVEVEKTNGKYKFIKGGTGRTARRIMEGEAIVPVDIITQNSL